MFIVFIWVQMKLIVVLKLDYGSLYSLKREGYIYSSLTQVTQLSYFFIWKRAIIDYISKTKTNRQLWAGHKK